MKGLSQACHLVGVSMGGMIAQTLALVRPDLVRSLAMLMTSTGPGMAKIEPPLLHQVKMQIQGIAGGTKAEATSSEAAYTESA